MDKKNTVAGLIVVSRNGEMHTEDMLTHLRDVYLKAVAVSIPEDEWIGAHSISICPKSRIGIFGDAEIEGVVMATPPMPSWI